MYQGARLTGAAWITALTEARVRLSMERRGRDLDNISPSHGLHANHCRAVIERLWRSQTQVAISLDEISDGFQARRVVKDWMTFHTTKRPHSALDRQAPDDAYWTCVGEQKAA